MKQTIRLTENELKRMISESIKRTLNEKKLGYNNHKALNESMSFGYTWENGFVESISTLIKHGDRDAAIEILSKWFGDEKSSWELYVFLSRIGNKPASQDVEDLYASLEAL